MLRKASRKDVGEEGEMVRKCGSVEVWRCESVKVWRCESEEVWSRQVRMEVEENVSRRAGIGNLKMKELQSSTKSRGP
jgi:hypothetical protein